MRIGVLSDTQDRVPSLRTALLRLRRLGITVLSHPGDIVAPFAAQVLVARRVLLHHAVEWCRPEHIAGVDVIVAGRARMAVIELDAGETQRIEIPT